MKTIKYLTMAALALLTAACSSDDNEQAQQPTTSNGMVTITAKLAPKTGTTRALELGQDGEGKDIVKVTWAKVVYKYRKLRLLCPWRCIEEPL